MASPVLARYPNPNGNRRRSIIPRPSFSKQEQDLFDLVQLEPRPVDDILGDDAIEAWQVSPMTRPSFSRPRALSPTQEWQDKIGGMGSFPKKSKPSRPMFAGPPPPITASMVISKSPPTKERFNDVPSYSSSPAKSGLRSLLFEYRQDQEPSFRADTTWRGLRRQEYALETEVQQLLDLQATGLISGLTGRASTPGEVDGFSESGSITPTGTFYSAVTRMASSIYTPMLSTADGSVIPVRQPKSNRPRGLKAARTGLRRVMSSLAQLKLEEDSYVDDALAQRRKALKLIERLSRRRQSVTREIQSLEEAEEEPLGQELRDLSAQYDSMTLEIKQLEERLIGLRNQRRWVRGRMEEVQNQKEAGLSGYRGALQEVDIEVNALLNQPPIQPLDLEALQQDERNLIVSTGGAEFLQLLPERRTAEMAQAWWESEVAILERYRAKINSDRQALDEGAAIWADVMLLVSDYERRLRQIISGDNNDSFKGKEKVVSAEDLIIEQLPEMDKVVAELEKHLNMAEDKHWTLLICAIGAELEAFREALYLLRGTVGAEPAAVVSLANEDKDKVTDNDTDKDMDKDKDEDTGKGENENDADHADDDKPELQRSREGSSDNEVPPDLLTSHIEERSGPLPASVSPAIEPGSSGVSSENEVPPEFLAVHEAKED